MAGYSIGKLSWGSVLVERCLYVGGNMEVDDCT